MDIQRAIINHYQEVCPHLQTRDNMLFFAKEGVIVLFEESSVILLSDCRRPDIMKTLLERGLASRAMTALDKMNQRRAWGELQKISRCRNLEYCNPRLFDIIDEAIHVPPLPT